MIDRPLRRIFAVGLFAREKQAGVAEAPDFPDEAAGFGFGVAGHIGLKPDDIEPPSDERTQPREQPMLEIGREAVDRAEQIVGQYRIISLARQQRGVGPVADDDAVGSTAFCRDRIGGLRRSEERRVGKEGVSRCSSWWATYQ